MLKHIIPTVNKIISRSTSGSALCGAVGETKMSSEKFENDKIWGLLTSIDIKNCDHNKIRDSKYIEKYVIDLCNLIDMKRFGPCKVVHFGENDKVAGYSMVQLIQTSCLTGHFANSTNSSYIDIFSCKYYDPDLAAKFTAEYFGSKKYTYNVIERK